MKINRNYPHTKGLTLLELTIVISVLILLTTVSIVAFDGYQNWQKGVEAGEKLQSVYAAQRLYLSDYPTVDVANITAADIIPYLPDNSDQLPTVEDLEGNALAFDLTVSPPTLVGGSGGVYDPTAAGDGQWDTGTN